jgi:tetratricopeptide (TPR) repeat protein
MSGQIVRLLLGVGMSMLLTGTLRQDVQAQSIPENDRKLIQAQATMAVAEDLYDHGDQDKAIEQWREAIRLDPGLVKAHYSLGMALRGKNQLAEAIAELREAVRLDPRNAAAFADLGDTLQENDDLDGALAAYQASLALVPNSAFVRNNLGYVFVRKNNLDRAISEWREATKIDPKYPAPFGNLGEALATKGDTQGAIAAYERFLVLVPADAPASAEVRQQLDKLKSEGKP